MQKSASLCTDAKSNLRHRVLGEVEKDSFITLPGKGVHRGILLRNPMCSSSGEFGEGFHGKGWRVDSLIRVCARFLVVCFLILMNFPSLIWERIYLQCRRPWFYSWIGKIPWRRDKLPTPVILGFCGGPDGKESARSVGDLGSIPGLGRSPGGGHGNLLQYSCLENPHGQRRLEGYGPWDHKESDTTEWLSTAQQLYQGI